MNPTSAPDLPLPSKYFSAKLHPGPAFTPMSRREAEFWLASYNAWIAVWNRHERSKNLPLSPPWPEAVIGDSPSRGVVVFMPHDCRGKVGHVMLPGYWNFEKGWSFCRVPADPSKIRWAGWRDYR
jgi:hypothetical protein